MEQREHGIAAESSGAKDWRGAVERVFEGGLWQSRFIVLLAVVASLVSAIILFLMATGDVLGVAVKSLAYALRPPHTSEEYDAFHSLVVGHIISSVDDYLLATVLLIFSLGLYELFISPIEVAQENRRSSKILVIRSLDDLKDRLAKVVLMILIVTFFKNVIHTTFDSPLGILYLGVGILFVALALYFTSRTTHAGEK